MKSLVYLFSVISLAGCATMSSHKDAEAIKKVKTAAVVAFIDKQDASNHMSFSGNTGGMAATRGGSSFYQKSKETDALYKTFAKALAKPTGWKMKEFYDVNNHPMYIEETKKIMPAINVTKLPPSGENWFLAGDLMTPEALDMLGTDERNKIAAALGVDAIVAVDLQTTSKSNMTFAGLGSHKPVGNVRFKVFMRDRPEPIWNEWIEGDKSEESVGLTGFASEDKIRQLGTKSLETAFKKIGTDPEASTKK